MSSYQQTLLDLLKITGNKPTAGETIIFIWKDKNHYQCTGECTDDVRVLKVPSKILTDLVVKNNRDEIAICCVGFGSQLDYSDLVVPYFMELGVQGKIESNNLENNKSPNE